MAINQIATLGVKVDPRGAVTGSKRAKNAITGIGKAASGVKSRILSLQGALLGLGAGALVKSIITTASSVESLKVRLQFLTKSGEEATQAFKDMNTFAAKVPFSLEEIERASPLLLTVAKDAGELNDLLAITGDIAAVSGLSFEATAGQLQRAMAGGISAADLFRERGVKAFLGFEEGVQFSAEQTKEKIQSMWRDGTTTAVGATEELAKTFVGQVSMMQDAFRELKLAVADAGVFDLAGETIKKITEIFRSEKSIENMKKFGETLTTLGKGVGSIIEQFMGLPDSIKTTGVLLAIVGGTKGKIALATLILFKDEIKELGDILDMGLISIGKTTDNLDALEKSLEKAHFEAGIFRAILAGVQPDEDDNFIIATAKALKRMNATGMGMMNKDIADAEALVKRLTNELKTLKQDLGIIGNEKQEFKMLTEIKDQVKQVGELIDRDLKKFNMGIGVEAVEAVEKLADAFPFLTKRTEDFFHVTSIMGRGINATGGAIDGMHGMLDVVKETTKEIEFGSVATRVMGEQFDKLAAKAKESQEKIEEFAIGLESSIEGSIMKMVQGLMSFKDVVKSVFQFVAQEMIKMNIAQPMASALSGIISGAFGGAVTGTGNPHMNSGGGFGDFLKNLFRADGGSVTAGQPYIVGERGAELFTPNSSGMITPNDKMGGQTINVTYSPQVNALDPRQAQSVIAENAPTIVAVVRQAFNQNGQQVAI